MSSVERASYRIDAVLFKKFARHACGGVRRRRVRLGPGRLTQGTSHRWEVPAHPGPGLPAMHDCSPGRRFHDQFISSPVDRFASTRVFPREEIEKREEDGGCGGGA